MAGESAFKVEGVIIETLSDRTFRVELTNGHKVLAFIAGRAKQEFAGLRPGEKVKLQMSPYDLSEGRILEARSEARQI
jgi:translation initiation factor IF-1